MTTTYFLSLGGQGVRIDNEVEAVGAWLAQMGTPWYTEGIKKRLHPK